MLTWLRSFLRRDQKAASATAESIEDILRSPGKACRVALIELAAACSKERFIDIVHCACLVGSAIRDGDIISPITRDLDARSNKTFLFKSADISALVANASLEHAIFVLRKERALHSSSNFCFFNLGRASSNDIRIVDFAISRLHARINLGEEGTYAISDLNSQNGTKVNGTPITATPQELRDGDIISLGRYEFTFLLPESLYDKLRGNDPHGT
jgi:hypothetical protein